MHVPRGGLCAQASPTLSARMSCVTALSTLSQNREKRKFKSHATSPGSHCQHPHRVVQGCRRSPKSQLLRKVDSTPSHRPAQVLGPMAVMRGHPLDWRLGWGAASFPSLNTRLCTRSLAKKEKGEKKKDPVWSPENRTLRCFLL